MTVATPDKMTDEHWDALNKLKDDYTIRLYALRAGIGYRGPVQSSGWLVKNRPILAIGSALTIGLLVGALIGRKSNHLVIASPEQPLSNLHAFHSGE